VGFDAWDVGNEVVADGNPLELYFDHFEDLFPGSFALEVCGRETAVEVILNKRSSPSCILLALSQRLRKRDFIFRISLSTFVKSAPDPFYQLSYFLIFLRQILILDRSSFALLINLVLKNLRVF